MIILFDPMLIIPITGKIIDNVIPRNIVIDGFEMIVDSNRVNPKK